MSEETVSLESLLSHRSWALRMARRLVREEDEAEELVQRTWMAALRRPPARLSGARAWIAKVILNLVREKHRREQTRRRHEGACVSTREESFPDTAETASRREYCQLLGEQLMALGEPYRSTLVLRYYDDMNSVEIGNRLGVPAGTVRWRLKVGLERLRAELDRGSDGDRTRWVSALALLLPDGKALPDEAGRATATSGWLAPASWIALGAATIVASVILVSAAKRTPEGAQPALLAAAPGDSALTLTSEEHGVPPAPRALRTVTPAEAGDATPAPLDPAPDLLPIEVLDTRGDPVPSARVLLASRNGFELRATTDGEGRAHLALEPGDVGALGLPMSRGHVSLRALAEGRVASELLHVEPPFGSDRPLQIRVGGAETVLRGRVVDERGEGVAGAAIAWADPDARPPSMTTGDFTSAGHVSTTTGADGRFALHHLPHAVGRLFCFAQGFALTISGSRQKHLESEILIRLRRGALVSGRLSLAGRPAAGVHVRIEPHFKGGEVCAGMSGYDPTWRGFGEVAVTDENGAFELTGVVAGTRTLRALDEASGSLAVAVLQLEDGGREYWEGELEPNPGLLLRVVDESSRPLPGWVAHVRRPAARNSWWIRRLPTDENGRLSIPDCPREEVFVDVFDPSGVGASHLSARLLPGAEEQLLRVATHSPCSVTGTVVDATGVPELGGQLVFHSLRTTLKNEVFRTERGDFEQQLPPGAYNLVMLSGSSAVRLARVVLARDEVLDLGLLTTPERGTLRLNGAALQNGDARAPSYSIFAAMGERMLHVAKGPLDSESVLSVYAGRYRVLAFDAAGTPARRHEVRVEPAAETRLDLLP